MMKVWTISVTTLSRNLEGVKKGYVIPGRSFFPIYTILKLNRRVKARKSQFTTSKRLFGKQRWEGAIVPYKLKKKMFFFRSLPVFGLHHTNGNSSEKRPFTANPNLFPILNHALKLFNKCSGRTVNKLIQKVWHIWANNTNFQKKHNGNNTCINYRFCIAALWYFRFI